MKDRRGHSPLSYALMRFKHDSPIVKALELLYQQLNIKLDEVFNVSAQDKGIDDKGINRLEAIDRGVIDNGGWSAWKHNIPMDDRCDVREEFLPSLLSNKEFFLRFINTGTPVIFRGVANATKSASTRARSEKTKSDSSSSSDTMQELLRVFKKTSFINKYGRIKVPASTIPYSGNTPPLLNSVYVHLNRCYGSNTHLFINTLCSL